MDCFVASAPVRKRFAFVAGNDDQGCLKIESAPFHYEHFASLEGCAERLRLSPFETPAKARSSGDNGEAVARG